MNELILNQGEASTSFLTLYDGFHYFTITLDQIQCVIAYVETSTAWIGASEPIANHQVLSRLLIAFARAAQQKNKDALLLPTSKQTAEAARALGYKAIEIGREPWFNLRRLKPTPQVSARQLKARGALVETFVPNEISPKEKIELDLLTEEWLDSRKMAPLGFLNRLEPWSQMIHKVYFRVIFHGQQMGYLAAVPIHKNNAWYFVDLIRLPTAPAGTTELLISEAMHHLQAKGYEWMTLGMTPFVPVRDSERKLHPIFYSLSEMIFNHFNLLYGFKSLKDYKDKFKPDEYEPQFLISLNRSLTIKGYLGLFQAIFPKGLVHTAFSTLMRTSRRFHPNQLYSWILDTHFLPRTPPKSWAEYFTRCQATLELVFVALLFFFISVDPSHSIRPKMVDRYAYSFDKLSSWMNVILASFLHWNPLHLTINLVSLVSLVGFLECIAGTRFVLVTYFVGVLLSNPLTSFILYPVINLFFHGSMTQFLSENDVGSSLGIFSCLGALLYLSRFTWRILIVLCLGIVIYSHFIGSWLSLNHIVSLFIGCAIGRIYVGKK